MEFQRRDRARAYLPFASADTEAVVDALGQQLIASIPDQMLADVPLGAFLFGGVDSSIVVPLMQKQNQQPVRTFPISLKEHGYNEAE